MNDEYQEQRRLAAWCALTLFIVGLALPLLAVFLGFLPDVSGSGICVHATVTLMAEFFALVFGFLGRRHRSGRVAMIGGLITIILAFLFPVFFWFPGGY